MIFVEAFLLGIALSMDAFAVSICKGLGMKIIAYDLYPNPETSY